MAKIPVLADVTSANNELADELRAELARRGILTLNLIASPGAGKTTLLERTIAALAGELRLAVVEGDLATSLDAERIVQAGAPAVQINTGGGCHLEAQMVRQALKQIDLDQTDVLVIENVGNLVCPTGWDLGEDAKVVVASLPEGDDKPLKYPSAFATAQAVVVNKIDLEPYLPARAETMRANALRINGSLAVFAVSCATGAGLEGWLDWLRGRVREKRAAHQRAAQASAHA
ncbi:MAG: hydrogenase nickel incorporation protein HypB [Chloroflexi bacterium]|nr:hydrogenase nickel incorporation protein HypB [Chloroflexota bacterium]